MGIANVRGSVCGADNQSQTTDNRQPTANNRMLKTNSGILHLREKNLYYAINRVFSCSRFEISTVSRIRE